MKGWSLSSSTSGRSAIFTSDFSEEWASLRHWPVKLVAPELFMGCPGRVHRLREEKRETRDNRRLSGIKRLCFPEMKMELGLTHAHTHTRTHVYDSRARTTHI